MTHVVRDRAGLAAVRDGLPGTVAVVMTMGALHDGHVALVRRARELADHVVVTVFVNPLQFGAGEDLDAYPRTLDADLAVCERERVDVVFAPDAHAVYPHGQPSVRVAAGPLGQRLEGQSRPGHFDGVLTVVTVLLHLVRPHVAVFGRKDRQQLALVRRLVGDLAIDVRVEGVPTVREPDGLALSSRNAYLSEAERRRARAVPAAGRAADQAAAAGAGAHQVLGVAREVLADAGGVEADYVALVDPGDLAPVDADYAGPAVLLLAARVGATRLIDNVDVVVAPPGVSGA
ncbi:pantoate--beta-alanine ligase [Aquipuribacter nitratireducens]|uniref:Pantothenate synthetase n=1 Tax=Aquipuribacter nitratireducens TaxID=650104 RepID=A0ABW0GWL1_9MICO